MNLQTRLALTLLAVISAGCSAPRNPCSEHSLEVSHPAAIGSAVYALLERSIAEEQDLHVLALSGGGQNGAYGAGLLKGWRAAGRPSCQLVTGVSTGALIATFAFLDSAEDDATLERMYTTTTQDDVLRMRTLLGALLSDALSGSEGMEELIARYVSDAVIDRVWKASREGARLLLVGTTNIEEGGLQLWNMSALARDKRYGCYRRVLLASSSIPILFPPVDLGGALHVDGGVRQHVFTPYGLMQARQIAALQALALRSGWRGKATVHVVVNSPLRLEPSAVAPSLLDVAERTIPTLLDSALIGDLWRVWAQTQVDQVGFRMNAIPDDMLEAAADSTAFDQEKMQALFARGVERGADSTSWASRPPPPYFSGATTETGLAKRGGN